MEKVLPQEENSSLCRGHLQMRIALLGATGSVGNAVISVIKAFPDRIKAVAVVGGRNVEAMKTVINGLSPLRVGMYDEPSAEALSKFCDSKVFAGEDALVTIWKDYDDIDALVVCVSGIAGFKPIYEGLRLGKRVFFSTKEALVVGGEFIMREVKFKGQLVPLDSEHWALYSCIDAGANGVKRLFLTASGGALRDLSHDERRRASISEVLKHPVWKMGKKITVDSATLMNKGFEVMEAHHLFSMPIESIRVLIHKEAWVHGMVEFADGSVKAVLFYPDMRLVVQEALLGSSSFENETLPKLRFGGKVSLTFEEPDLEEYPCLSYAYYAGEIGGNVPVLLNAADDLAVSLFLDSKLSFWDIPKFIRRVLFHFPVERLYSPEDIYFWDEEARNFAKEVVIG